MNALFKTFFITLLTLNLALPQHTIASCQSLFPIQRQSEFLSFVEKSKPLTHWKKETTWLQESKAATLMNAAMWVSVIHLFRFTFVEGYEWASWAFAATILADPILSYLSHIAALVGVEGKIGTALKGKPKTEFVSRTLINMGIGVGSITGTWTLLGIPFTGEHVLGALGLCAGVYPTLQLTKGYLFDVAPAKSENRFKLKLERDYLEGFAEMERALVARGHELGFSEDFTRSVFLSALDAILLSKNYEEQLDSIPTKGSLMISLVNQIETLKEELRFESRQNKTLAKIRRLMKARRKLINELISYVEAHPQYSSQIAEILYIEGPLDPASFFEFQKEMRDRSKANQRMIARNSILDQAIAVGLAGGIFLFQLNHWVETDAINR